MTPAEVAAIKRMVEFAYLYCWGEGGYEARVKFKRHKKSISGLLRQDFTWDSKRFRWKALPELKSPPLQDGQCPNYREHGYNCGQPAGHEGCCKNEGPFAK